MNHSIILMRQPDNDKRLIRIYHESLKKIWEQQEKFDRLAIGHDGILLDKAIVKDYLELTGGLLDGSIVGKYEEIGFRKGDVARLGQQNCGISVMNKRGKRKRERFKESLPFDCFCAARVLITAVRHSSLSPRFLASFRSLLNWLEGTMLSICKYLIH